MNENNNNEKKIIKSPDLNSDTSSEAYKRAYANELLSQIAEKGEKGDQIFLKTLKSLIADDGSALKKFYEKKK